ncbi:acetolactate synthase small subunit [Haloarcula quadrata]|jgi:acetolactate synthase-1/3 small subunit|uniref:Acetolactate synthase small subunit n=5 Tax=Haloarcula TaxID=2237 RepID=M0JZN7_9EURY|nr:MULTISPECIES: acetolactate synthase small subunit [Haloarcula]EMA10078.1 acetolactate synthase small subunit [Haloarcula vallismortis ATCC 29715]EMA13035.1 acetolactate synthase small subunit [Haloarcula sinaiiensis ATCC 33800]EMA22077.1 acetolactate synthase small subunit [Haloarcula californiae ATCC 33799]NHN64136.1 acetolactate synthase small subunit [Haloarcula sp. JP-Z28]NHX38760.1 acetolactate synthase small subunit [Haloarcula sp. R1-2]
MPGPAPDERMRPKGRRNTQGIRVDPEAEVTHEPRQAVLSALVKHRPGVLSEVSALFSRRQFNIESLTVGPTVDDDTARMTILIEEPEPGIDQAKKQLRKLVPVISVRELEGEAVRRELALVKVSGEKPDDVNAVADMYNGQAVDASTDSVTVEITGSKQKIDAAIEAFKQFDVQEIVRTGAAALERGPKTLEKDV